LLRALGVRERQTLVGAPYELIEAWSGALAHPGMAAQFTNPVGFAVTQMRRGQAPPPVAELDRWAERGRRNGDRYETWRYVEPIPISADAFAHEQRLEARVRALAPPDADIAELCELARHIEAGATDKEALAWLHGRSSGGTQ
jgi:hypothetical protein